MKKIMNWVLAVILVCGASVMTACSSDNDDNPVVDNSLAEKIVGTDTKCQTLCEVKQG